ncbi:MAG: DUF2946 family protein [Alphaproteobacteria bacterium]
MTYINRLLRTLASGLIAFCLAVQAPVALAQATRYAALSDDLASSLCGMQKPASHNNQSPGETGVPAGKSVPCPVCQAGHLAANLLPPAPTAIIARRAEAGWHPIASAAAAPIDLFVSPQQARAPPSV